MMDAGRHHDGQRQTARWTQAWADRQTNKPTSNMTTDAMKAQRDHYLDNLKVFLTILVIFHHAGQAYGDGGAWAYTPSNPAETMP